MIKTSKGEKKIGELLSKGGIKFKREVTFNDLRGSREPLRFDFGIYRGNKLIVLLEHDGSQHFTYTPFFHKSRLGFQRYKEHDIRKNRYCLIYSIPLIRIPYWELDNLTLEKIFNTKEFIVTNKYHNLNLIAKRGEK